MRNILTLALLLVVWAPYTVLAGNRCVEYQVSAFLNETDRVIKFLDEGVDVNCRQPDNSETALMMASRHSSVEVVQLLLDRGADVNARNKKGETVLRLAQERHEFLEKEGFLSDAQKQGKVIQILKQANAVE